MTDDGNRTVDEWGWLVIPKEVREKFGAGGGEWALKGRLRAARAYLGLTQCDVTKHLHIHRSTYLYYETGKSHPSLRVLRELCAYFGVSPEFLLGLERHKGL
ncbi:MAG: helix-turn-helix domain-containing protein [Firmicutes bacterium]|nr:helix-turn-helix domain-containing protein [Bacillota bacterium]